MVQSAVLGFPRIGPNRELKKITEAYWKGKATVEELFQVGKELRASNWNLQKSAGVDIIPSNDFSYYDQVLDLSLLFNVIPERYAKYNLAPIDTLFAMGRGLQKDNVDVPALEMVKWFDSNYHYVRPTFSNNTQFKLNGQKPVDEYLEAKQLGVETRPVIVGPVSYLYLGKADRDSEGLEPISLLNKLLPVYSELLSKLKQAGAKSVQIDEPVLVLDLPQNVKNAYKTAFEELSKVGIDITLTTYFGDVRPNLDAIKGLPVSGYHFDLTRAPEQLAAAVELVGNDKVLSAGVVSGRNVWKTDYAKALKIISAAQQKVGDRLVVATSSSLLHTPVDLSNETKMDAEVKDWFSFATQKLDEVVVLAGVVTKGPDAFKSQLETNAKSIESRHRSERRNNQAVKDRLSKVGAGDLKRKNDFATRLAEQKKKFNLPMFPTTTIGSFPQTPEIRVQRNKFAKGQISAQEYEQFINKQIDECIKFQEQLDLDVLVHGEPERNDMVQYFGERLNGFAFTTNGWVQSFGSRYVRPPIIVGDVSRPAPMTVKESKYAQSITNKPCKGMLTGPVTILRWSFPRDDLSDQEQCQQLALALRDEVNDLEAAGVYVIQVDEPAIREGLPLRAGAERDAYVQWAPESFRLATSGVEDGTQIHSHFCYSDLDAAHIKALDADVVTIEFSKKDDTSYIKQFANYPNHLSFGVFDIHSPRVPTSQEMFEKIQNTLTAYPKENLYVSPDCGLKTRGNECFDQLKNMVDAAKRARKELA